MTSVIHDIEAVQNSFLPSLELFHQATGSKAAAAALQIYLTILYYSKFFLDAYLFSLSPYINTPQACVPSQWITSSRMTWAFSRDVSFSTIPTDDHSIMYSDSMAFIKNGLPFSNYWAEVDSERNIPIRATLLSAGFCTIYGLLYIASTQAFNSIINTAVLMLNITYTVPQAILIVRGRAMLPARHFNLRNYGYLVHVFSVLWLILSAVLFFLPTSNPPTLANMN